jgi:hypothetical protein
MVLRESAMSNTPIHDTNAMQTVAGGYIVLSARGIETTHVPVTSADEASAIWWHFVKMNDLGASDLKRDSGQIRSNDGKLIARVSYNGRVWSPDGSCLLQEWA